MHVTFVSGGCRSGKSAYAQSLAEKLPQRGYALFVATAYIRDAEMQCRVEAHKEARGQRWRVCEPVPGGAAALAGILPEAARGADVLLLDCLTLWVSAYMEQQTPEFFTAKEGLRLFTDDCGRLLRTLRALPCPVILVSNELGLGMVPESASARLFRDYAGTANQLAAAEADCAVFMVSGLPVPLKGRLP